MNSAALRLVSTAAFATLLPVLSPAAPAVEQVTPAAGAVKSDAELDAMEAALDKKSSPASPADATPADKSTEQLEKKVAAPRIPGKGQYFRFEVGVGEVEDITFRPQQFVEKNGGTTVTSKDINKKSTLIVNPGTRVAFAAGYNFNEFLGVEFEIQAQFNSLSKVKTSGSYETVTDNGDGTFTTETESFDDYSTGGSLWQVPVFANINLQYPTPWKLTPFAGFGGGLTFVYTSIDRLSVAAFGLQDPARVSGTVIIPAWQAYGGLRYEFNKDLGFQVAYKYMATSDYSFNGELDGIEFDGLQTHAVTGGLVFRY